MAETPTHSDDSGRDSDSGMGESASSLDDGVCQTCQLPVDTLQINTRSGDGKWAVKVYAANGMMAPSAWAAAWMEMERVDVEISPWVNDGLLRRLAEGAAQEHAERAQRKADAEAKVQQMVEERMAVLRDQARLAHLGGHPVSQPMDESLLERPHSASLMQRELAPTTENGLPQVYRSSQIPMSVLLRNYVYLLAQDRRNVIGFFLAVLVAYLLAVRPRLSGGSNEVAHQKNSNNTGYTEPFATILGIPADQRTEQGILAGAQQGHEGVLGSILDMAGLRDDAVSVEE